MHPLRLFVLLLCAAARAGAMPPALEKAVARTDDDPRETLGETALPRSEADDPAPATAAPRADGRPRLEGLRVLAAHDNRMNQRVVRRLLESEGVVVRTGRHGAQPLRILDAEPTAFDVVLMHIHMPVMDGLPAAPAILADGGWAHLPVLALTAGTMAQDIAAAEAADVSGHLAKPSLPEQLVCALTGYRTAPGSNPATPD